MAGSFQHGVVALLGFGRRDVADGFQQPAIVEPVHPLSVANCGLDRASVVATSVEHRRATTVALGLLRPRMQRLRRPADLGGDRRDRRPARGMPPSGSKTIRAARARTSEENLLVVLLVMAPPSQELEPPINPERFIRPTDDVLSISKASS